MALRAHDWQSGLLAPCGGENCSECCDAYCFNYCIMAKLNHFLHQQTQGMTCWMVTVLPCADSCCYSIPSCVVQTNLRQEVARRYNIEENGCTSCLKAFFCLPCSAAQIHHETIIRAQAEGKHYTGVFATPDLSARAHSVHFTQQQHAAMAGGGAHPMIVQDNKAAAGIPLVVMDPGHQGGYAVAYQTHQP